MYFQFDRLPHSRMNLSKYFTFLLSFNYYFLSFALKSFVINRFTRNCKLHETKSLFPEITAEELLLSKDYTELPDSFQDAVSRASKTTLKCLNSGKLRFRIDFDTSIGDLTYTTMKNTMPMLKDLVKELTIALSLPIENDIENSNSTSITPEMIEKTIINTFKPERTLRIFFPDMGAAVLARRDWKLGTLFPEVPPCVFTSNIQNDGIESTDQMAIILCPRYSETDYVKRVLELCDERSLPCILINPELINMDQGFGMRARNIKKDILNTFTTTYKLITLKDGALVREWPKGYSVWAEDTSVNSGYVPLQCYANDPPKDVIQELFEVS